MKCPYCGKLNNRVIDSRLSRTETEVRRRRECQECLRRFTTFETVEDVPVMIVKKDGRREEFVRAKIMAGIKKACGKRNISADQIEELVDMIERDLRELSSKEISTRVVGEMIMAHLHRLDDVAYVRFASVYREFSSVDDFIEALKDLNTQGGESDTPESENVSVDADAKIKFDELASMGDRENF